MNQSRVVYKAVKKSSSRVYWSVVNPEQTFRLGETYTVLGLPLPGHWGFHGSDDPRELASGMYLYDARDALFRVRLHGVVLSDGKKWAGSSVTFLEELSWEEALANTRRSKKSCREAWLYRSTGTLFQFNSVGLLDSPDNDTPAVRTLKGEAYWFKNGLLHRDGGLPAVLYASGGKKWYLDGKRICG